MAELREIIRNLLWIDPEAFIENKKDDELIIDRATAKIKSLLKSKLPKKKEHLIKNSNLEIEIDAYNLCHDEFTAWLVERLEKIEEIIKLSWLNTNARADLLKLGKPTERLEEINKEQCEQLATAIKTMIMGGEK